MQSLNLSSGHSGSFSPFRAAQALPTSSPVLPFRAKHKSSGKFAFLPFLNSTIPWEFPGAEEQQHPLFTGREPMRKISVKHRFNYYSY